jgi:hypothetical protein
MEWSGSEQISSHYKSKQWLQEGTRIGLAFTSSLGSLVTHWGLGSSPSSSGNAQRWTSPGEGAVAGPENSKVVDFGLASVSELTACLPPQICRFIQQLKGRVVREAIQKMQPGGREGPRHQGTPLPAPVEVRQEGKVGDGQGWLLREGG